MTDLWTDDLPESCISNLRSMLVRAGNTLAPNTFAMFSLVLGFDLVAKTMVFFPFAIMLLTENLTSVLIHAYA